MQWRSKEEGAKRPRRQSGRGGKIGGDNGRIGVVRGTRHLTTSGVTLQSAPGADNPCYATAPIVCPLRTAPGCLSGPVLSTFSLTEAEHFAAILFWLFTEPMGVSRNLYRGGALARPEWLKFEAESAEGFFVTEKAARPSPPATGSEERCKLPQWGSRRSPDCKCIFDALREARKRV